MATSGWQRLFLATAMTMLSAQCAFQAGTAGPNVFPENRIRLHVDDPAGLKIDWPMTVGVPFPRGCLKSADNVRLTDGAGKEVPCQVDQTATWLDGSVRWIRVSFTGRTDGAYFVKFGENVSRMPVSDGIQVSEEKNWIVVNTGPAEFKIRFDGALIDEAKIGDRLILKDGARGAYLVDNQGRRAILGGKDMDVRIVDTGAFRTVIRAEGWYRFEGDSPANAARGVTWMYFSAQSPVVRIVHRLILTEDTNKLWFKDIGIEFPSAFAGAKARFDTDHAPGGTSTEVTLAEGDSAWMLQDDYPHFLERGSHFSLVHRQNGKEQEIVAGPACGEWCDLSDGKAGYTVALREFAEQFPKEFEATSRGVTARLWAGRSGRELDFRADYLAKNYFGEWVNYYPGYPHKGNPPGVEGFKQIPSNAQATSKTHELFFIARGEPIEASRIAQESQAATQRVLLQPDPAWTCTMEAVGPAMQPKDAKRFPNEERLISDFFDRIMFPYQVFPLTGYIAWGVNPNLDWGKDKKTGRWYPDWYRLRHLVDYNLRRSVWTLWARSGERKYLEWGERFNRFACDMEMHHWDVGKKFRGGFGSEWGHTYLLSLHIPLYWGDSSEVISGSSGTDMANYLYQYYFLGDRHAWETIEEFGDAIRNHYDLKEASKSQEAFLIFRMLLQLYSMKWDEYYGRIVRELAASIMDPNSPNGFFRDSHYGPLYKVTRNLMGVMDYYLMTGDPLAKETFLKAVDYEYRFKSDGPPLSYQNGTAFYYSLAYQWTKRPEYLSMVNAAIERSLAAEKTTLAEDLAPGLDKITKFPYRGLQLQLHPLFNMPIALRVLALHDGPIQTFPLLVKHSPSSISWAVFDKPAGKNADLWVCYWTTHAVEVTPIVLGPDLKPASRVRIVRKEKQMPMWNDYVQQPGQGRWFVEFEFPADLPAGEYRVGCDNPEAFYVLKANVDRMVLECPEGVWIGSTGMIEEKPYFFSVPEGETEVRLFLSRDAKVTRPDGSVAEDTAGKIAGEMTYPVQGKFGLWGVEQPDAGHVIFRNINPIVAFGEKDRFFLPKTRITAPKPDFTPPPTDAVFTDGVIGKAIQINDGDSFRFPRGDMLPDGTYLNFPFHEGTIEFYYRPNWSTVDFPVPTQTVYEYSFLNAGSIELRHYFGRAYTRDHIYGDVTFLTRGWMREAGKGWGKDYGNGARKFFRKGEWTHVAATWRIDPKDKDPKRRYEAYVFIDGKKRLRTWSYPYDPWYYDMSRGRVPLIQGPIAEWIQIGTATSGVPLGGTETASLDGMKNGCFDEFRISDVVRYESDFTPPKTAFEPDSHAKALFHFDDNSAGIGAEGKAFVVEFRNGAMSGKK